MDINVAAQIAAKLELSESAVQRAVVLLDEGAPVPFVARYRIEETGGMDEGAVGRIAELLKRYRELLSRQSAILQSIDEQGSLTEELHKKIIAAGNRTDLEDLYLPYRPKPATRAIKAIEAGLVPLAELIWSQKSSEQDISEIIKPFVDEEKGIAAEQDAWQGARDICAERISMLPDLRRALRNLILKKGNIACQLAEGADEKKMQQYKEYSGYSEPVKTVPVHRVLAMRQGEKEGILSIRILVDREEALAAVRKRILKNLESPFLDHLESSLEDAYDRLLAPAMEGDVKNLLRDEAEDEAIQCIAKGVYLHLVTPPFGPKKVMSIVSDGESGYAYAVVDGDGKLLKCEEAASGESEQIEATLEKLLSEYKPEGVAVGRSPSARKAHTILRRMMQAGKVEGGLRCYRISEHEAGFYAGSSIAREEMPDDNQTVKRAVSVARRMQDPLKELVKVDPCCINVSPLHRGLVRSSLIEVLERVFISCASNVGADVNKADRRFLSYISGIGPQRAGNLTRFREEKGLIRTRSELHQVRGMTPESFSACSPYLFICDGENPLDATGIHPERYKLVEKMAEDLEIDVEGLLKDSAKRKEIKISDYIDENTCESTLRFIMDQLGGSSEDFRGSFADSPMNPEVISIEHLKKGMILDGVVTSVTDFGAFVDIGVEQDGLVHLSQLSHKRLSSPFSSILIGERVKVAVMDADVARKRISLSVKGALPGAPRSDRPSGEAAEQRPRTDRRPARAVEKGRPRRPGPNDRRQDARGNGGGKQRDFQKDRPRGPKKPPEKKGPSPYSPFAALKMVDGKIVMDDQKSGK